jgi:hypothetical protein
MKLLNLAANLWEQSTEKHVGLPSEKIAGKPGSCAGLHEDQLLQVLQQINSKEKMWMKEETCGLKEI